MPPGVTEGLRGNLMPTVTRSCAGLVRWGWAALAGLGLLATACQPVMAAHHAASHGPAPARVTITMGNLTLRAGRPSLSAALVDERPDLGIGVSVTGGRLSRVVAVTAAGRAVQGRPEPGGASWHTEWALAPSRAYRVTATAVNRRGRRTVATATFRTLRPRRTFTAWSSLAAGQVYGVGMPLMLTFSRPVTRKAEVERSLEIWSSRPVTGAWHWMSNREVWFRTRKYWPAHTRVRLEAHLRGVRAAPGVYGLSDLSLHLVIGNSLIAVASAATHHMKVWWNGHLQGNWPISTGQPGDDTPDGHYLSFSMGNPVDMNSATYGVMPGDPGYYNVLVYDSVKFTFSGDYVHSAPWSVGEQGFANVSHGCVNVAPGNAAWYYARSVPGDPITIVGSPLAGTWGDGWTIWFLPWHKLAAGSATGQAVLAGPSGSRLVPPPSAMPAHPRALTRFPWLAHSWQ
jgi:lipoprotein-anchoring transpeptidase ErfK/SrfK